jgi:hypothetical protein
MTGVGVSVGPGGQFMYVVVVAPFWVQAQPLPVGIGGQVEQA